MLIRPVGSQIQFGVKPRRVLNSTQIGRLRRGEIEDSEGKYLQKLQRFMAMPADIPIYSRSRPGIVKQTVPLFHALGELCETGDLGAKSEGEKVHSVNIAHLRTSDDKDETDLYKHLKWLEPLDGEVEFINQYVYLHPEQLGSQIEQYKALGDWLHAYNTGRSNLELVGDDVLQIKPGALLGPRTANRPSVGGSGRRGRKAGLSPSARKK